MPFSIPQPVADEIVRLANEVHELEGALAEMRDHAAWLQAENERLRDITPAQAAWKH